MNENEICEYLEVSDKYYEESAIHCKYIPYFGTVFDFSYGEKQGINGKKKFVYYNFENTTKV